MDDSVDRLEEYLQKRLAKVKRAIETLEGRRADGSDPDQRAKSERLIGRLRREERLLTRRIQEISARMNDRRGDTP